MNEETSLLTNIPCKAIYSSTYDIYFYDDPVTGRYGVQHYVIPRIEKDKEVRNKLACVLASRLRRGISHHVLIVYERAESKVSGTTELVTIEELLAEYPKNSTEMIDAALLNISLTIEHPTHQFTWGPTGIGRFSARIRLNSME